MMIKSYSAFWSFFLNTNSLAAVWVNLISATESELSEGITCKFFNVRLLNYIFVRCIYLGIAVLPRFVGFLS